MKKIKYTSFVKISEQSTPFLYKQTGCIVFLKKIFGHKISKDKKKNEIVVSFTKIHILIYI